MRDRKGQEHIPGWAEAVWGTPIQTEGRLPGGGALFASCARAVEEPKQTELPGPLVVGERVTNGRHHGELVGFDGEGGARVRWTLTDYRGHTRRWVAWAKLDTIRREEDA